MRKLELWETTKPNRILTFDQSGGVQIWYPAITLTHILPQVFVKTVNGFKNLPRLSEGAIARSTYETRGEYYEYIYMVIASTPNIFVASILIFHQNSLPF